MDYEEVKQRIFYSKQMRDIHKKQSPIKGYGTAGESFGNCNGTPKLLRSAIT